MPSAGCRPRIAIYINLLYAVNDVLGGIIRLVMSFRIFVTLITLVLLAFVVYFGWPHIEKAWLLMSQVNPWVFMLIIPLQIVSYYSMGEVVFSYLRQKGNLKKVNGYEMAKVALESNFVDSIVPVPAAAGFSYLSWRLHHLGVRTSRSAMAQMVRYVLIFTSFVALIFLSAVFLFFDHKANRNVVLVSTLSIVLAIFLVGFLIYVIKSKRRLTSLARWLSRFLNKLISVITFGRKCDIVPYDRVNGFLHEMHQDYVEIRHEKKLLAKPLIWAFIANILDVSLFFVAFLSLGYLINPAALFISFGLASVVTIFAATPGGTGVYEAIMITSLVSFGVPAEIAIAGTLLARAILLVFTILFGYVFYQLAINKYGKVS